jgi:hypothetical protein
MLKTVSTMMDESLRKATMAPSRCSVGRTEFVSSSCLDIVGLDLVDDAGVQMAQGQWNLPGAGGDGRQ